MKVRLRQVTARANLAVVLAAFASVLFVGAFWASKHFAGDGQAGTGVSDQATEVGTYTGTASHPREGDSDGADTGSSGTVDAAATAADSSEQPRGPVGGDEAFGPRSPGGDVEAEGTRPAGDGGPTLETRAEPAGEGRLVTEDTPPPDSDGPAAPADPSPPTTEPAPATTVPSDDEEERRRGLLESLLGDLLGL